MGAGLPLCRRIFTTRGSAGTLTCNMKLIREAS